MAFNIELAERLRNYLLKIPGLAIEEKKMFGGLAFMVDGKMCVNVSGDNLMCRYDPEFLTVVSRRKGYLPMIMKGKEYKGYCYVEPNGFDNKNNFEFWMKLCLDFNEKAKESGRKK